MTDRDKSGKYVIGHNPNSGTFKRGHPQYLFKNPKKWISKVCICGSSFESLIVRGVKFCSKSCRYKYRKRNGPHSEETKRKIGLANRKFYSENPEKHSKWKGGVTRNPGYKSAMKKKSRLHTIGYHSWTEWENLKIQYLHMCPACGRNEPDIRLTQDHIVPLILGGNDYIENIQPLCGPCNTRKMTKTTKYDIPNSLET